MLLYLRLILFLTVRKLKIAIGRFGCFLTVFLLEYIKNSHAYFTKLTKIESNVILVMYIMCT